MHPMPTTPTIADETVPLQAQVRESVRTHINIEARKARLSIGEYLTQLVTNHAGYIPPAATEPAPEKN